MATQLTVVNECLATMGESPLASLAEDHEYKTAVLNKLDSETRRILAKGWWFNMESVTLTPSLNDNRIYVSGDTVCSIVLDKRPDIVQRGRVLYDLANATDQFPAGTTLCGRINRMVTLDDMPVSASEYIATTVVLWFQSQYDGDQTKTRNLMATLEERKVDFMSEHIRNRKVNLLDTSVRLAKIRNITRQMNRY